MPGTGAVGAAPLAAEHLPFSAPLCVSWTRTLAPRKPSTGEAAPAKHREPRRVRQQLPFIHFPFRAFCIGVFSCYLLPPLPPSPARLFCWGGRGEGRGLSGFTTLQRCKKRNSEKNPNQHRTQNSAERKRWGSPADQGRKRNGLACRNESRTLHEAVVRARRRPSERGGCRIYYLLAPARE